MQVLPIELVRTILSFLDKEDAKVWIASSLVSKLWRDFVLEQTALLPPSLFKWQIRAPRILEKDLQNPSFAPFVSATLQDGFLIVRLEPTEIYAMWRTKHEWQEALANTKTRLSNFTSEKKEGWVMTHDSYAIQCVPSSPNFPWQPINTLVEKPLRAYSAKISDIGHKILHLLSPTIPNQKGNLEDIVDDKQSVLKLLHHDLFSDGWIPHGGLLTLFPMAQFDNVAFVLNHSLSLLRRSDSSTRDFETLKDFKPPEEGYLLLGPDLKTLVGSQDIVVVPGLALQALTETRFISGYHCYTMLNNSRHDCQFELRPKLDMEVDYKPPIAKKKKSTGLLSLPKRKIRELIEPFVSSDPLCSVM